MASKKPFVMVPSRGEEHLPMPIPNAYTIDKEGLDRTRQPFSYCYAEKACSSHLGRRMSRFSRIEQGKRYEYSIDLGYSVESCGGTIAEGYHVSYCPGYLPGFGTYGDGFSLYPSFADALPVYNYRVEKMKRQGWTLESQKETEGTTYSLEEPR